jgi:transposase
MLALDPMVVEAVWQSFSADLPERPETAHPLGCHRPRRSDRGCFEAILFRHVTGCSWDVAGRLGEGSETTLRRRRDEWVATGAFDYLVNEAIAAFDKVIGLDLSEVSIDGSLHKAPAGGEGTGPSPVDRSKTGWKWSVATDTNGVPIGWVTDGANRNDSVLLASTLDAVGHRGLLADVVTLDLDRGYDNGVVRTQCLTRGSPISSSLSGARRAPLTGPGGCPWACGGRSSGRTHGCPTSVSCGATPTGSSLTAWRFALAVALIITVKLLKWSKRWGSHWRSPHGARA